MDLNYILQNTIIYWSVAFTITNIFNNSNYLNFSIWIFLVLVSYITHHIFTSGLSINIFLLLLWSLVSFYSLDFFILKYFENSKKRELLGLIFTLWFSIFLWNLLFYIYWPNSISLNSWWISITWLVITLFILIILVFYLYKISFNWKILKALSENNKIVNSIWINSLPTKAFTILISFIFLMLSSYIILNTSSIWPQDAIFYLIKWIWIMIIVWVNKIEYMFVWAFLYVLLEHTLFINLWLPIWYKESLVLLIILLILILKPTWIFSLKFRNI